MPTPVSGLGTSGTSSVGVLIAAPFGSSNPRRSRARPAVALELVTDLERVYARKKTADLRCLHPSGDLSLQGEAP